MFDDIAPRYDLLNRLLSLGIDRHWRRACVGEALAGRKDARVLDLCCGTGDLSLEFDRSARTQRVFGSDFSQQMLRRAVHKSRRQSLEWVAADSQHLPFQSASFDVVSVAFGLRNLVAPQESLREWSRVLAPGGTLAILEFYQSRSRGLASLFRFYFRSILPTVGGLLSGAQQFHAYRYLPESVESFASPGEVNDWVQGAGIQVQEHKSFLQGAVGLLIGRKIETPNQATHCSNSPSPVGATSP